MEATRRRERLEMWLTQKLPKLFIARVLTVTGEIADVAGRMLAAERTQRRTPDAADVLLAATAKHHRMGLATLNRRHFDTLGAELAEFELL